MNKGLKYLNLFFRCLIKFLFSGGANKFSDVPDVVMIVAPFSNVGDVVTTTPVFRAIKEKYPKSLVFYVGKGKAREILEYNKYLDKYIDFHSYKEINKIIKDLSIKDIIILRPDPELIGNLYLSTANGIVTVDFPKKTPASSRLLSFFSFFVSKVILIPHKNVLDQYLSVLKFINIDNKNNTPNLGFSNEAADNIKERISKINLNKDKVIIGVAPGCGSKYRIWPTDRMANICNFLAKKYYANFVFIGAGDDKEQIDEVITNLDKDVNFLNFLNQSIDEMKATFTFLDLVITNDSAPAQFARSFGVPTIVFAGPTDETEKDHIIVGKNRGNPITYIFNYESFDKKEAERQIGSISVEQAKEEIEGFLKKIKLIKK